MCLRRFNYTSTLCLWSRRTVNLVAYVYMTLQSLSLIGIAAFYTPAHECWAPFWLTAFCAWMTTFALLVIDRRNPLWDWRSRVVATIAFNISGASTYWFMNCLQESP